MRRNVAKFEFDPHLYSTSSAYNGVRTVSDRVSKRAGAGVRLGQMFGSVSDKGG